MSETQEIAAAREKVANAEAACRDANARSALLLANRELRALTQ